MKQPRPLGYWVKLLDQLIEENLNQVLMAEGIQRRHWQTMNLLRPMPDWDRSGRRGPAGREAVAEKLRPFWSEGGLTVDEVLYELVRRGWITECQPYGLTTAGVAAHTALAKIVEQAGRRISDGVTPQQYADTVEVLSHMVENAESLRRPDGRSGSRGT